MRYLWISIGIFFGDLFIKNHIEDKIEDGCDKEALKGMIRIRKVHNQGAMLSFMEKRQEFVSGFSMGMFLLLLCGYLYLLCKKGFVILKTALSFVIGGAGSNIFDRVKRGYVVDYFSINTRISLISRVVFNISDFFIFAGSIFIIVWDFFRKE